MDFMPFPLKNNVRDFEIKGPKRSMTVKVCALCSGAFYMDGTLVEPNFAIDGAALRRDDRRVIPGGYIKREGHPSMEDGEERTVKMFQVTEDHLIRYWLHQPDVGDIIDAAWYGIIDAEKNRIQEIDKALYDDLLGEKMKIKEPGRI
jgi:hypothetical protein